MDNMQLKELIISSADVPNKTASISVWDPYTGNQITSFKEGFVIPKGLSIVGQDYIACALQNTPLIKFWSLNKKDHIERKFVVPGTVTALAVSPSGVYCIAGINKNIFVWNVSTGVLEAILPCHYGDITCLKFTDDGWYFVSAGTDTIVAVWRLNEIFLQHDNDIPVSTDPIYKWSDNTNEITNIYIGYGGNKGRLVTVSSDCTCHVYDLSIGLLIFTVFSDMSFTSVVMDPAEYFLILGADNGNILRVKWFSCLQQESANCLENDSKDLFRGHSQAVICLSTSCDGAMLVSGSIDGHVIVWDIMTKVCMVTFRHFGPVTNAFFMRPPMSFFTDDKFRPSIMLKQFQKSQLPLNERLSVKPVDMRFTSHRPSAYYMECCDEKFNSVATQVISMADTQSKTELEERLNHIKNSNRQLYSFSMSSLLDSMEDYRVFE